MLPVASQRPHMHKGTLWLHEDGKGVARDAASFRSVGALHVVRRGLHVAPGVYLRQHTT